MARQDQDMKRMSELQAEARSISARRNWVVLGRVLDEAKAVVPGIEPNDGESKDVKYRPGIARISRDRRTGDPPVPKARVRRGLDVSEQASRRGGLHYRQQPLR